MRIRHCLLSVFLFVSSGLIWAQCRFCAGSHCFQAQCPTGGYQNCACNTDCECAGPTSTPYLDALHPGFFVHQENAKSTVSWVIPNSPADKAGLKVGDQIVAVRSPVNAPKACDWPDWTVFHDHVDLVVQSGNEHRSVRVSLRPIADLLWSKNNGNVRLASGGPRTHLSEYGPFTTGLSWGSMGGLLWVTEVLSSSPAEEAGLSPGMRILAINGIDPSQISEHDLKRAMFPDSRVSMVITVQSGVKRKTARLVAVGLSALVRAATRERLEKREVALAIR